MKTFNTIFLKLVFGIFCCGVPSPVFAEAAHGYNLAPAKDSSIAVSVFDNGDGRYWKLENSSGSPATVTLLEIENPEISAQNYKLTGKIRYHNVVGRSYLEMWSHFTGGRQFFTRTLAETGTLQTISGESDWRTVELPFSAAQGDYPQKISVNLVMAGNGEVYLTQLSLSDFSANSMQSESGFPDSPGQWFSTKAAIYFGAYGGAAIGILCGLLGILGGMRIGRSFVLPAMRVLLGVAAVLLSAGVFAVIDAQPYAIYYPLLLIGGLLLLIIPGALKTVSKRYQEDELRKISSMDMGSR